MRNYQGFGSVAEATANARKNSGSQIFKWAVGLIIACLFMASAVCRAHDGHEHTTPPPVINDDTPAPAPFIESGQGRLYNEIEMMGIYGSALPPDPGTGADPGDLEPLNNPFLGTSGECEVPAVPLPAAVWAGLAGGAIVLGRGRGGRRTRW
jgi:hypothetical protein